MTATTKKLSAKTVAIALLHISACGLAMAACSSSPVTPPQGTELGEANPVPLDKSHAAIIERNSAGDSEYSGFYNTFEFKATILNYEAREALINRQTEYYKWDEAKTKSERDKARQEMASETSIFLSFFTPDRHNDNLADTKAIWRILLDVGNQRYVGKAKKLRTNLAELQALYPYHTRWNTPYLVTFPVPVTSIESQPSKLTITGPLGTRSIEFKALK